jgi:aminodeoxyfutalosine deaminase
VPLYSAEWVLPIASGPIRNGWIEIDRGRITAVGGGPRNNATDLGNVVVLPSLVNAHTHLELSHLRGVIPRGTRFVDWIRGVMAARRQFPDPSDEAILSSARAAIAEARRSGTGLVGDISNTLVTAGLLEKAGMPAHLFYELTGFNATDPGPRIATARDALQKALAGKSFVRGSLAPHAPYSVSPAMFGEIRRDVDRGGSVTSVHLAESPEEVEFVASGTGPWHDLLVELGAWSDAWQVPAVSPAQYLLDTGFARERTLAVHCVQCTTDDLLALKNARTTVVSCPRSNRYVGAGDPPLEDFYESGVPVAFGTDSLASVEDLNVFGELAAAR